MSNDEAPSPTAQMDQFKETIQQLTDCLKGYDHEFGRLNAVPLVYGTVLSANHIVKPETYAKGEQIMVIDQNDQFANRCGTIVSEQPDKAGKIKVSFPGTGKQPTYIIGATDKEKTQVQLLSRNDGTHIVVSCGDGKEMECLNSHRFNPKPGDRAKYNSQTQQIVEVEPQEGHGDMVSVVEVDNETKTARVESGNALRLVRCLFGEVKKGDRVVLDAANKIVIRHFPAYAEDIYKVEAQKVAWTDIGGCNEAKRDLYEAIVAPYKYAEVFKFYNQNVPKGFLLYGPPGCGKTLLGKATHAQMAEMHGKKAVSSGFNYVKGPEILNMWVGESERITRAIFERGRQHFEKHGYPCVTFVDECDAIFKERGGNQTQPWMDTLVAMWLAEMDGMQPNNGILIFATNRPRAIDGAVVREGRIDKHIKVPRPDQGQSQDVFKIHMRGIPFQGTEEKEVAALMTAELFSTKRPLYNLKSPEGEENFNLGHCISGSFIAGLVQEAKAIAIRRDMRAIDSAKGKNVRPKGVQMDDFHAALDVMYQRHASLNHEFDISDFCEIRGFDPKRINLERVKVEC